MRPWLKLHGPDPTPPVMNRVFNMSTSLRLTSQSLAAFGVESGDFRMNDAFAPFVGQQPYGWDQFTPMYRRFLVHSVDVECLVTTSSSEGVFFGVQLCAPGDSTGLSGFSIGTVDERNTSIVIPVVPNVVNTLKFSVDMWDLLGVSRQQYVDDDQYQGTSTSSPAVLALIMKMAVACRATATANGSVLIRLAFHTQMFARATFGAS